MRRYLVVANQTLGGAALEAKLRTLAADSPISLHFVVPATPPRHHWTFTEGEAASIASERLERALERFRDAAHEVSGEVGVERPVDAIRDALRGRPVDEIVLSTLPAGPSRWLKQDLPSRIGRTFDLPVSHVIGEAERKAG